MTGDDNIHQALNETIPCHEPVRAVHSTVLIFAGSRPEVTTDDGFSQLLDPIPVTLVFIGFVIVALATYEIGFRLGRWWQLRSPDEEEGPTGMMVGSILALLAFLLAVTMGMASDRFDARRGIVRDEVNTIGTTFLRAGYLPEPYREGHPEPAARVRPAPDRELRPDSARGGLRAVEGDP